MKRAAGDRPVVCTRLVCHRLRPTKHHLFTLELPIYKGGQVAAGPEVSPPELRVSHTPWQTAEAVSGGISVGGIIVIIGILLAIFWSLWAGIIIAVIGLIAFGGFARSLVLV